MDAPRESIIEGRLTIVLVSHWSVGSERAAAFLQLLAFTLR